MRQAGIIAAAGLYALDHNIDRMVEDHQRARRLADAICQTEGLSLQHPQVETNMVIFRVDPQFGTASEFAAQVAQAGVGVMPFGPQLIRLVTHLDVDASQAQRAAEVIRQTADTLRSEARIDSGVNE